MKTVKSGGDDWLVRTAAVEIRVRGFGPIQKEIERTEGKVGG
ncbi:MAG TPA: hypothetical protein VK641_07980 [Terriglobales bacterium]|nr:hypothetical protein [Terriglobales bacterium]